VRAKLTFVGLAVLAFGPLVSVGFAAATANYGFLQHAAMTSLMAALASFVCLIFFLLPACKFDVAARVSAMVISCGGLFLSLLVAVGLSKYLPGTFEWIEECTLEWRNGGFTSHSHQHIEHFTNNSPAKSITLVVRDNHGGRLIDARLLAFDLPTNRIHHVHVEGHCTSACTTLFLSAPSRSMADDAKLKFHGVYNSVTEEFDPVGFARYRDHAHKNGISMPLLDKAAMRPYKGGYEGANRAELTSCADGESCVAMRPRPLSCSSSQTDEDAS